MGAFGNSQLNDLFSQSILEEIKHTLQVCSEAMLEDSIKVSHFIDNHEEKIRNRLYAKYLDNSEFLSKHNKDATGLQYIIEVPENFDEQTDSFIGRLDIKVISINLFKSSKIYYSIECKRIDGYTDLNRKYVCEGISRFIGPTVKYSSYFGRNLMFGFVVKEINIGDNCMKIEEIQQLELKNYIVEGLKEMNDANTKCHFYLSKYTTVEGNSLELQHMFFDFSSIIRTS